MESLVNISTAGPSMFELLQEIQSIKQSLEGVILPTEIVDGKITKYKKITFLTEDEENE